MGSYQHPVDRMKLSAILNNGQDAAQAESDEETEPGSSDDGRSTTTQYTDASSRYASSRPASSRSASSRPASSRSASSRQTSLRSASLGPGKVRKPRPACKKYDLEQGYFIWYQRIDLGKTWDDVNENFTRQFGEDRGKGGLQCKYYRVLGEEKVDKVRAQGHWYSSNGTQRGRKGGRFGVIQRTNKRFPWMLVEDQLRPISPCFTPQGCRNADCDICWHNNNY